MKFDDLQSCVGAGVDDDAGRGCLASPAFHHYRILASKFIRDRRESEMLSLNASKGNRYAGDARRPHPASSPPPPLRDDDEVSNKSAIGGG